MGNRKLTFRIAANRHRIAVDFFGSPSAQLGLKRSLLTLPKSQEFPSQVPGMVRVVVDASARAAVWDALQLHFREQHGIGPQGDIRVPSWAEQEAHRVAANLRAGKCPDGCCGGELVDAQEDAREHYKDALAESDEIPQEPLPGTYAATAFALVRSGLMDGDEADRWKDEMKDRDMGIR